MDAKRIAAILRCPASSVEQHWPAILACLEALQIATRNTQIAALATVAVETAHKFEPIHEYGGHDYYTRLYEHRHDLGNCEPGDGAKFHGRGFIQITGRANYASYGKLLGVDLVANPDAALEPCAAATILAAYFRDHKVNVAADEGNWVLTRRLVNGGRMGWDDYMGIVEKLEREMDSADRV